MFWTKMYLDHDIVFFSLADQKLVLDDDDLKRGITPFFQYGTQHSTLQHRDKINQCCNLWPDVTVPEKLQSH